MKITKRENIKKNKEKESEDEEDKINDHYLKQKDEPPGPSKHLQKKVKKQARKQAKVGLDRYFTLCFLFLLKEILFVSLVYMKEETPLNFSSFKCTTEKTNYTHVFAVKMFC